MGKEENRLEKAPIKGLLWRLGLPSIVSMILQALYNVVDSVFVANIEGVGELANEALTYAFPIQILMIALGVGTGVGINSLLSGALGEKNKEKASKAAGNGIFLSVVIYLAFLIFGLFGSEWFISLFTADMRVKEMGSSYLRICSVYSLGSISYSVYERFLMASGKTLFSTIAQISGALINIVFDYLFIYPLDMGVKGAAIATVFGQFVSLFVAMGFFYFACREIDGHPKYIKPVLSIIGEIYRVGFSAIIMQGLLSLMMGSVNKILLYSEADPTVLVGSFGIYYKVQQMALFASFGLSNTIITVLSFSYASGNKKRCEECIKWGIVDTLIVMAFFIAVFEALAPYLAKLFSLSDGGDSRLMDCCQRAIRIASLGYLFMGFNIATQGILQALRYSFRPLSLIHI